MGSSTISCAVEKREHIGVPIPEEQQLSVPAVYLVTACALMASARIFGLIFQEAIYRVTASRRSETRLRLREWVRWIRCNGQGHVSLRSQRHAPVLVVTGNDITIRWPFYRRGWHHRILGAAVGFRRFVNSIKPYLGWSVSGSFLFELVKGD